MERYTERITDKETGKVLAYRMKQPHCAKLSNDMDAMQKLGRYEDLEEQLRSDCRLCGSKYDFRMVQISNCLGKITIALSGNVNSVNQTNGFKFCPECGRRLTKENFNGYEI